jgi:hypothetical protein
VIDQARVWKVVSDAPPGMIMQLEAGGVQADNEGVG